MADVARKFAVSKKTVHRYLKLYKQTGSLEPGKRLNKHLLKIDHKGDLYIKKVVEKNRAITLKALKDKFKKKFGVTVSERTIGRH